MITVRNLQAVSTKAYSEWTYKKAKQINFVSYLNQPVTYVHCQSLTYKHTLLFWHTARTVCTSVI